MQLSRCDGFTPEQARVACIDRWPPGRLRQTAKAAYDRLAQAGVIRPEYITRDRAGATYIHYTSTIPHEWTREELAKEEQIIRDGT